MRACVRACTPSYPARGRVFTTLDAFCDPDRGDRYLARSGWPGRHASLVAENRVSPGSSSRIRLREPAASRRSCHRTALSAVRRLHTEVLSQQMHVLSRVIPRSLIHSGQLASRRSAPNIPIKSAITFDYRRLCKTLSQCYEIHDKCSAIRESK